MAESRAQLLREAAAAVDLSTSTADRRWLPELEELGRRMDVVEERIDAIVSRLLPAVGA